MVLLWDQLLPHFLLFVIHFYCQLLSNIGPFDYFYYSCDIVWSCVGDRCRLNFCENQCPMNFAGWPIHHWIRGFKEGVAKDDVIFPYIHDKESVCLAVTLMEDLEFCFFGYSSESVICSINIVYLSWFFQWIGK